MSSHLRWNGSNRFKMDSSADKNVLSPFQSLPAGAVIVVHPILQISLCLSGQEWHPACNLQIDFCVKLILLHQILIKHLLLIQPGHEQFKTFGKFPRNGNLSLYVLAVDDENIFSVFRCSEAISTLRYSTSRSDEIRIGNCSFRALRPSRACTKTEASPPSPATTFLDPVASVNPLIWTVTFPSFPWTCLFFQASLGIRFSEVDDGISKERKKTKSMKKQFL